MLPSGAAATALAAHSPDELRRARPVHVALDGAGEPMTRGRANPLRIDAPLQEPGPVFVRLDGGLRANQGDRGDRFAGEPLGERVHAGIDDAEHGRGWVAG